MIISLTITSSGPLTFTKLGSGLQHQIGCNLCIASFFCKLLIFSFSEAFNSAFLVFFRFLSVSLHLFAMSLKLFLSFSSVLSEMPFYTQFCQRLDLLLPWFQNAFHQVLSSDFHCLVPECSPLDFCCAPCCSFLTKPNILWSTHYCFFSLCFRAMHCFPGRVLCVLLKSCEIFFNTLFSITSFLKFSNCSAVIGFHPRLFHDFFVCASSCILAEKG